MGNQASAIKPVPPTFGIFHLRFQHKIGEFRYVALTRFATSHAIFVPAYYKQDKDSTLHANEQIDGLIKQTIKKHWPGGIKQSKAPHKVVDCFQLGKYDEDTFFNDPKTYVMFCAIVDALAISDWHLVAAPDLFVTLDDAELVFRRETRPMAEQLFCMRILDFDKLEFIGAPADTLLIAERTLHPDMEVAGSQVVKGVTCTFKLKGHPWSPKKPEERAQGHETLLRLLTHMADDNVRFRASACIDGEQDVFFFSKSMVNQRGTSAHAMIGLCDSDQVFVQNFDKTTTEFIAQHMHKSWAKAGGVIAQKWLNNNVLVVRLAGQPWMSKPSDTAAQAVAMRAFVIGVLDELSDKGWQLLTAADISESLDDLSAFIFRHVPRPPDEPSLEFCGIQPSGNNDLMLINMKPEVQATINKVLGATLGSQNVKLTPGPQGSCSFSIPGKPWSPPSPADALMASHVISVCIAALYMNGYSVIGVADLEAGVRQVTEKTVVHSEKTKTTRVRGIQIDSRRKQKLQQVVSKTKLESSDMHMLLFASGKLF